MDRATTSAHGSLSGERAAAISVSVGTLDHYATVIALGKCSVHDADELARAVLKDFKLLE